MVVGIGEGRKHQRAGAAEVRRGAGFRPAIQAQHMGDAPVFDPDADAQLHALAPRMGEQAPGMDAVDICVHCTELPRAELTAVAFNYRRLERL